MKLDAQDRRFAETMAAGGVKLAEIAESLSISVADLVRQVDGLEEKASRANARVISAAFELATSGKAPSMTMFWLRCRLGWTESRKPMGPLQPMAAGVEADASPADAEEVVFHMPGDEVEARAKRPKE